MPAPGSPLIDAAPLSPSLVAAIPVDAAGNPRLQGAAFDIGAFESTGSAVAQAVASTTSLSQNNGLLVAQVSPATGSGAPSGTVSFNDGSTLLGTANLVNGTASYAPSLDTTVAHTLSATYSGDANFLTSTSSPINIAPVVPTPAPAPAPATPTSTSAPTPTPVSAPAPGPVVLLTPSASQTVSGLVAVTAAITVNLDAAGAHLVIDGQGTNIRLTNAPYLFPLDTTQLSNGAHTIQIWAHDINNNVSLSNTVGINVAN